jgi:hypothetical protein
MGKRDSLIQDILRNGKQDKTWEQLARVHGIHSGEAARHAWRRHKREMLVETPYTISVTEPANIEIYQEEDFTIKFQKFLESYKAPSPIQRVTNKSLIETKGCLIFNKQDAHLNKFDIHGKNDIEERFKAIEQRVAKIIKKASLSSTVDKIVYVLGSDQFNSEWNGMTTKGTEQQNILTFHESFEMICNHEVRIINHLLENCEHLHIMYVSGNHDEYLGWHLMTWLKAYYRNQTNLSIDTDPSYRKYIKYGTTGMMFNHGDVIRPVKLAQVFPMEFKDNWSSCNHYYIFTGDKHREMNADFNGIKFYGIPALSISKSRWDDKNGYIGTVPEMTAFLVEENSGMTQIFKEIM